MSVICKKEATYLLTKPHTWEGTHFSHLAPHMGRGLCVF